MKTKHKTQVWIKNKVAVSCPKNELVTFVYPWKTNFVVLDNKGKVAYFVLQIKDKLSALLPRKISKVAAN
jgi:hypothetical protein